MKEETAPAAPAAPAPHSIADHKGLLAIQPVPDKAALEILFDPAQLTENDIRSILTEHVQPPLPAVQKYAFRLDGRACEAAALRLEKRVEKIPGVRRATATYVGRVLCLTFDSASTPAGEEQMIRDVKSAGADIRPLAAARQGSLSARILRGELNEELSCALGLILLIAAAITERALGVGLPTHLLYAGAYVFCGQQGLRSAINSLREKTLDVDVLMILAAIGAAIVGHPFEGALLLFLFSFSNVLQSYALERTQRAVESLLALRPDTAFVKRPDGNRSVPIEELQIGDIVIVRPGEHVPVDGLITEGSSSIDESSLTGESMPVSKTIGATLFAGTLNQTGAVEIRVGKRAEDSTLARMVRLVAEAQAEKSTAQRFLEKAEQAYAAGVIAFTILVMLVPWLLAGEPLAVAFYRAMTVMVVASPCALVISTPATVLSAIGGAARRGILIKGGSRLEQAARVDIVAFDKTGTLTQGKPAVTDIILPGLAHPLSNSAALPADARELLADAAALETKSEHPLAAAIVQTARKLNLPVPEATDFQSTPGKGAEATVQGRRLLIGSERLLREAGATGMEPLLALAAPHIADGKGCVWLGEKATDGNVAALAILALADILRPESAAVVAALRQLGVKRVVMLTGDHATVAAAVARQAGVDECRAGLLPEDKVEAIRELKKQGSVMMVGDGVNDAPALALADLGLAMGAAGADVAMETADIVLMGDRLESIPLLIGIARQARSVLWQNLAFASAVILLLIAAALGFALPLPIGVIGHEGSTVLVCLNGLRLLVYSPRPLKR